MSWLSHLSNKASSGIVPITSITVSLRHRTAPLPRLPLLPCVSTLGPRQKGRFQLHSAHCADDKYTSEEQDERLISCSSSPKRRIKKKSSFLTRL